MSDSMLAQMKKFLVETNAMSLALGVVIGGAVTKLIGSLVDGLIMPLVSLALPGGEWRDWRIELMAGKSIAAGNILGATLDFMIIAFVVYIVASKLLKIEVKK